MSDNNWLIFGVGVLAGAAILAVIFYGTKALTTSVEPRTNEERWEYTDRSGKVRTIKVHRRVE